jgi:NADH-quinone oxidoreductase subunit H
MQGLFDRLMANGWFAGVPPDVVYAAGMLAFGLVLVFGFVMPMVPVTVWLERRVWSRIQSRIGPNRVGPQGVLQGIADGAKNILKEDIVPDAADRPLFLFAPYLLVWGFIATFVVVPFSSSLIIADLNVGILYLTAMTALSVVGVLMAGWASNNKWSLLGGIRSAAQVISYEIPAGLAIIPIVLLAGTLSMQDIIREQGWAPWDWYAFHNPFTFIAALIFYVSALAEANRTPFDIPEAESELVAGFATEYSGMRFALFFLAEWGTLYVIGAVMTTLFLGGWHVPIWTDNVVLLNISQFVVFFLKSYFWAFVAMWLRATLPRVRVDQLMSLCWKYLVPIGFLNIVGTAVLMVIWPHGNSWLRYLMFVAFVVIVVQFFRRVVFHIRRARPELYFNPAI